MKLDVLGGLDTRFATAVISAFVLVSVAACGGGHLAEVQARASANARSKSLGANSDTDGACDGSAPDREVSQYDTSGDDVPDVRKVFVRIGEAPSTRLVLICREADLNADGIKDVVRHYTEEGRPLREEADRDFDGTMDEISFFDGGHVIRQEVDTNGDGRIDGKIYFEFDKPIRAERDTAARSTPEKWIPDRWEYYEQGRLVRVGSDLDGDGKVDRWDRNNELRQALEEAESDQEASDSDGSEEGAQED